MISSRKFLKKIWMKSTLIISMGVFFSIFLSGCDFHSQQHNFEITRKETNRTEWHFAILPHFMLNSDKVNLFYDFLKTSYYSDTTPDKIVVISPNHFHPDIFQEQTICESSKVNYNTNSAFLSSELVKYWVNCDEEANVFYSRWNTIQTNEHWIWEHFQRINKYFTWTEILPMIMPSYKLEIVEDLQTKIKNLTWNILVLASVDFTHYLSEEITLAHDEKSIEILTSHTINKSDFSSNIDADCPTCLYLLQKLAHRQWQKANLRLRDSSSTILWKDMWKDNTSRIFIRYSDIDE